MNRQVFLTIFLISLFFFGCNQGNNLSSYNYNTGAGTINFDPSMNPAKVSLLMNDLNNINTFSQISPSPYFLQTLNIPNAYPQTLYNWLNLRIEYILSENFNIQSGYPISSFAPPPNQSNGAYSFGNGSLLFDYIPFAASQGELLVTAYNVGALYYLSSFSSGTLYALPLPWGNIPVSSPRVGVIQIMPGLFSPSITNESTPQTPLASLLRLAVLFHEARHSDGNGQTTGFQHVPCWNGNYQGQEICDNYSNGSYAVEYYVFQALISQCSQCSPQEMLTSQALLMDLSSRINYGSSFGDPTPIQGGP